MTILKEGSTGQNVFILQQRLKILNYFPETITGSFGYETLLAVKKYQMTNGLSQTGEVDSSLWNLLESQSINPITKTKSVLTKPILKFGDNNDFVKELQDKLKQLMYFTGETTGYFGSTTLEAVKSFQLNNKITADGVVGKDTWSSLINLYSPLANCSNTGATGDNTYIVKSGDSLWSIANRYNTTVNAIKLLNNLSSDMLYIGQSLKLPSNNTGQSYIVKPGDSLWSIANKYNTTVNKLKQLNNLNLDIIYIGQSLKTR